MKIRYVCAIALFALSICGIAFLSIPNQTTRVALYLDSQELNRAEKLLKQQYEQNPDNLDTAAKLVETLQTLKEFSQAKTIVQNVLSRHPDNIYWKRQLAYILIDEKNPEEAARILGPEERDKNFWGKLAQAWHDLTREELAEKALFEAHANDSDKTAIWRILAKWRRERNDSRGEKSALDEALKISPSDKDLLAEYFRNRAKAGDIQTTLKVAEKLPQPLEREFMEDLYKLYIENNDYGSAQKILEQLIARNDTIPADTLALVSVLYHRNDFAGAQALLDKLADSSKSFSPAVRDAINSQSKAIRMALLLEHAKRGNEQPLLNEIANMSASPPDQAVLHNVLYACMQLSDFHNSAAKNGDVKTINADSQKNEEQQAQFWLDKAQAILESNKDALPLSELDNAYLIADLAERRSNWADMRNAWETIAKKDKTDLRIPLGIARASQHLGDYETSWQNLLKAENLAQNGADKLTLALQAQALASALPNGAHHHAEKLRHADELARKYLVQNWNTDLAVNLFFSSLAADRLNEADELLQALEKRGLATPTEYLGLAEDEIAAGSSKKAHSLSLNRAAHNAQKALENINPDKLPRLLYIFMALHDKQKVADIIKRIKQDKLPQSPALLRQLAEAWAFLGDQKQQLALLEQCALLTGNIADWEALIDKCYWSGDHQQALELLEKAETIFPAKAALAGRRLVMLTDMGHYHQAIKFYLYIRDRDNEIDKKIPAESLAALALAYDREGYTERGHHFYNLALAKEPANNRAVFGLADLYRREGNKAKAAHLLRGFVDRNPSNLWAHADLAELSPNQKKKQYEEILASKQHGGADEKEAQAVALWKTGHIKQALHIYSELIKENKHTPAMMRNYAQALMDVDKFEDAKKILSDAISQFPKDLLSQRLLAAVYIHEKEYKDAEKCLRAALHLAPGNKNILRDLAFVRQAQNKFWSAQKNYMGSGKR